MSLDEEKLEALRSWGERLEQTSGEESTAVGRAILMLVEEIDRLHVALWHARLYGEGHSAEDLAPSGPEAEAAPVALHMRVKRLLQRGPDTSATAENLDAPTGNERPGVSDGSAQAWLESLRRQK